MYAIVCSSSDEDLAGEDLVEEAPEARDMLWYRIDGSGSG
jgi:hypothetical protein